MAAGPPRYNEPLASSGEKKLDDDDGLLRVATIRNNACIPAAEQGRRRKVERSESGVAREREKEREENEAVLSSSHFGCPGRSIQRTGRAARQAGANGTQLNDWYQREPPVALAGMSRARWRWCARHG